MCLFEKQRFISNLVEYYHSNPMSDRAQKSYCFLEDKK